MAIGSRAVDRSLVGVHQPLLREQSAASSISPCAWSPDCPSTIRSAASSSSAATSAASVFSRQQLDGFGFDVEVLFIARKLGLRIVEVPVRWDNVEGTKVSIWNGLAAFADPLGVRWNDLKGLYK